MRQYAAFNLGLTLEANSFWQNKAAAKWCTFLTFSMIQLSNDISILTVAITIQKVHSSE